MQKAGSYVLQLYPSETWLAVPLPLPLDITMVGLLSTCVTAQGHDTVEVLGVFGHT